jgi:mRNA interferase RelE/StbE
VNFEFKKSFAKDLKKNAQATELRSRIRKIIQEVSDAENVFDIKNLKKLRAVDDYYRIRLGDYRIGLKIEHGTVR